MSSGAAPVLPVEALNRLPRENRVTCQAIFTFSHMTFHDHFMLCALTALAGWLVGRIASRASRIPGFTFGD